MVIRKKSLIGAAEGASAQDASAEVEEDAAAEEREDLEEGQSADHYRKRKEKKNTPG